MALSKSRVPVRVTREVERRFKNWEVGAKDHSEGTGHRYRSVRLGRVIRNANGSNSIGWLYAHASDVEHGILGSANRGVSLSLNFGKRFRLHWNIDTNREIPKVYNDWRERLAANEAKRAEKDITVSDLRTTRPLVRRLADAAVEAGVLVECTPASDLLACDLWHLAKGKKWSDLERFLAAQDAPSEGLEAS